MLQGGNSGVASDVSLRPNLWWASKSRATSDDEDDDGMAVEWALDAEETESQLTLLDTMEELGGDLRKGVACQAPRM